MTRPAAMIKAGLDEDTEKQITTVCSTIWAAVVVRVVVGYTNRFRPKFPRTSFSEKKVAIMKERGGYSGPQSFRRTVSLVLYTPLI